MMQAHPSPTTLAQLSALSRGEFTAQLSGIFEHSPWIPEAAWEARPFSSVDALHAAMTAVLNKAGHDAQLALIKAHPELAGKEAASGTLTASSTNEQKGAGLDQCSPDELAQLRKLNALYLDQFGFPFVIAVKGFSRYQIMDAIEARLKNNTNTEFAGCLAEISKIARLRLDAMFS